jgi:hypothetical protein
MRRDNELLQRVLEDLREREGNCRPPCGWPVAIAIAVALAAAWIFGLSWGSLLFPILGGGGS